MRAGEGTRCSNKLCTFPINQSLKLLNKKNGVVVVRNSLSLEALPVDDSRARLIVLLLGDPHLLEGGEGSQDGASDPDGVLPLWGSDDLDLDGGGSQGGDLFCMRSAIPGYMVVPPDMTVLAYPM